MHQKIHISITKTLILHPSSKEKKKKKTYGKGMMNEVWIGKGEQQKSGRERVRILKYCGSKK